MVSLFLDGNNLFDSFYLAFKRRQGKNKRDNWSGEFDRDIL